MILVKQYAQKTTLVVLLMAHISVAGAVQEQSQPSPLTGNWIANISKSKRHPKHLFKSASLRFTVLAGVVTLNYVGVNMSGVEEKGTTTFHPDGKEHQLEGLPGAVEVSRWVSPRVLETVARQNGKVIGQSTFEVSNDGKTLTATVKGVDGSGESFEQIIVCDREI